MGRGISHVICAGLTRRWRSRILGDGVPRSNRKNAVKEKLQGDGVRLTLVPPREIAEQGTALPRRSSRAVSRSVRACATDSSRWRWRNDANADLFPLARNRLVHTLRLSQNVRALFFLGRTGG